LGSSFKKEFSDDGGIGVLFDSVTEKPSSERLLLNMFMKFLTFSLA